MPSTPRSISGSPSLGDSYLPTSGNSGYLVEHYDIDLDYRVSSNRLVATTVITAVATVSLDRFSLDVSGLIVDKVTIAGVRPKKVTSTARKLVITPEEPLAPGERFEVAVRYHGSPHPLKSGWGEVGWEELADGVLVASQPNGASSWFPCNDHPSNKATYDITVLSEPAYTVIANGTLLSKTPTAGRTRWTFAVAEPMATYLATVQIGRYRSKRVAHDGPATTLYFPGQLAASVAVDFARVGDMIAVFSDRFGPYPFETYGVIVTPDVLEIPLEAHGLAIFGSNHVDGEHGSDRLIAHELAHQWFGNSLTVTSWKDIWLQEGFACYAEWIWGEASGGESADRAAEYYWKLVDNQPKDIVVGDPGPRLMFDDRVYKRGALGLHAVRRALGDDAFFDALRSLTTTCRFGGVTLADLITAFGENGMTVTRILDHWVYSKALPKLR